MCDCDKEAISKIVMQNIIATNDAAGKAGFCTECFSVAWLTGVLLTIYKQYDGNILCLAEVNQRALDNICDYNENSANNKLN